MGSGSFSYTSSATRAHARAASGTTAFGYSARAARGAAPKLHPSLDLTRKPHREARDNPDNPRSTPIAVLLDVTGSMAAIPELVINELHKLMRLVLETHVVSDPQILFGAIGDANCDSVPIAMGEFEASDELAEAHLANIFLEGGGGGQVCESYELAMYFFANHVFIDAYEKRGEKGFLFLIGDEAPYPKVNHHQVKTYLGVDLGRDVPLPEVARRLQEKFHVFCIRPGGTSHFADRNVHAAWTSILPSERVIQAQDWQQIVPTIAATVALTAGESMEETASAMKASGFDPAVVNSTVKDLVPLARAAAPVVGGLPALGGGSALALRGRRL